jgi:hypothetical protein
MSDNLCWKCREFAQKQHWDLADPSLHCHHEPKEKQKCWCERFPRGNFHVGHKSGLHEEDLEFNKINFCPECGRKL